MENEYVETNGYEEVIDYSPYDEDYNPNEENDAESSDASEEPPPPPPKKRRAIESSRSNKVQSSYQPQNDTRAKENCPYCGVGYYLGYLQRHVLIHNNEKNPVCKLCEASVKGQDLWDHYCNEHPEVASKQGKMRQKKNYKAAGSSGGAPKKAKLMESSFGNEFSRFIGIDNSSVKVEREFRCELCSNALFHMKSDLNNHMTYCHPNYRASNVSSKFICTVCGLDYGNQYFLQEHMDSHLTKESKSAVDSLLQLESLDDEEFLLQ